ncbi:tetratricopeptide repeat protein [Piscinibacter terrae]|uniref:Uncharacterized protein n=1 Tax=Piscinibacter terrae TaxID=2496871 RepID=A0A3N7HUN9_9BURK|nr:tetratricopeptide repeat protein [Albitalea terrae]RQP25543.1 hypothetical protein DZC73_00195 [Albitalea terrae]
MKNKDGVGAALAAAAVVLMLGGWLLARPEKKAPPGAVAPADPASAAVLANRVAMHSSTTAGKGTPAELALSLGNACMERGDPVAAEELYRAALVQDPGLSILHSALGASLHLQKKFSEAGASYRRALELDATNLSAQVGVAGIASETGHHDEAVTLFQKALQQAPDEPVALWGLAVNYQLLHDPRAAETFRRYLVVAPPSDKTEYAKRQLAVR